MYGWMHVWNVHVLMCACVYVCMCACVDMWLCRCVDVWMYATPCYTLRRCYTMRVNMLLFSATPLQYIVCDYSCRAARYCSMHGLLCSRTRCRAVASLPVPCVTLPLPLCRRLPCVTVPLRLCRRLPCVTVPLPLCRRLPCVTVPVPLCERLPCVTARSFRGLASILQDSRTLLFFFYTELYLSEA